MGLLQLCLVWVLSVVSFAEPRGLIIATYNVRNYLSMDRIVEGKWRPDYPKPESEKAVIRNTIRKIDPDILALQEIGSLGHLKELQIDLKNEGLVYDGLAILEAGDAERRLAALWKSSVQITPVYHRDLTINYDSETIPVKRGLLELKARSEDSFFRLFIVHLKSKYTDNPSDPLSVKRRTLEARAIRNRILDTVSDPSSSRFILSGDMNDGPNTAPMRAFYKRGRTKISVPIDCFDKHGLNWTHNYKKQDMYSRVDYILRSPGFIELEKTVGSIDSSSDYYTGSDHRMVWIEVGLPFIQQRTE